MPKTDQGVSSDRYCVIPRVLIFIFKDDRVLLLKGSPKKRIWPNRYNGIGGHIEQGEDVLSAAKREVLEETGLALSDFQLCGTVMVDTDMQRGIGLFVYRTSFQSGIIRDSSEGKLEWVSMENLASYDLVEDLPIILPRIYRMNMGDSPFSAVYAYDQQDQLVIRFGE